MKYEEAPPVDEKLLDWAVDITRSAGDYTLEWFRNPALDIRIKKDKSPVTNADLATEEMFRKSITEAYPSASVIGEEFDDTQGDSNLTFYVDPIDGTVSFVAGVPSYSNLLAIHDEHGPAIGVIHLPALEETVHAGRGRGCFLNGMRVDVNDEHQLSNSTLVASDYSDWPVDAFTRVQNSGLAMRGWGDAYGYALVASGRVEAMVDYSGCQIWDFAPMVVIMREAGGKFTDINGNEQIDSGCGLATNGKIHDQVLELFNPKSGSS